MTVERNSNNKYTPPVLHGQKRKAQPTLPLLPNILPVRVQVKLSDYAPLENPEKALALAMRLKEIEERGEEVLLITRHEEELEEANRMGEATTDEKHEDGGITAPLVIPEIDELERRLASVAAENVEGKRAIIREWVRGLQGTGSLKPLDEDGQTKRRSQKEIETDELLANEWVRRLAVLFVPIVNNTHLSQVEKDYNVSNGVVSKWAKIGIIRSLGMQKNRVLVDGKAVAIACSINRRFGGYGSRTIANAMRFYYSFQ